MRSGEDQAHAGSALTRSMKREMERQEMTKRAADFSAGNAAEGKVLSRLEVQNLRKRLDAIAIELGVISRLLVRSLES